MRSGFTLLEILIVISITIMISGIAISYNGSTQQQIGLYVEVQKLAELILRAKSLAVSTYRDPGNVPVSAQVAAPVMAPYASRDGMGSITAGSYYYAVTFVTSGGETTGSPISNVENISFARRIDVSNIPISPDLAVIERKIYRTLANGTTLHYVAKIANNYSTYYTDNNSDASISGNPTIPTANTSGESPSTTCGYGVSIDYDRNGYELFSYRVPRGQECASISKISNASPNEITVLSSHDVAPGVVILQKGVHNIYKVFFVPPTPLTLISINPAGAVNPVDGKIYLTTKDASLDATISVSAIGQVDF